MSSGAWSAVFAGIGIVVAGIAVFVAVRAAKGQNEAARQQLRAAAWNMIARLDETLREYGSERQWVKEQAPNQLEDQKTDSGKLDIVGYMGAFERLNELLGTAPDIVSEKTVHAFYGPRLRVLLKTARARELIDSRPAGWVLFISLALKLDDYGRRNNRTPVIAVPGRDPESGPERDEVYRKELEKHLRVLADAGDGHAKELLADLGNDDGPHA